MQKKDKSVVGCVQLQAVFLEDAWTPFPSGRKTLGRCPLQPIAPVLPCLVCLTTCNTPACSQSSLDLCTTRHGYLCPPGSAARPVFTTAVFLLDYIVLYTVLPLNLDLSGKTSTPLLVPRFEAGINDTHTTSNTI